MTQLRLLGLLLFLNLRVFLLNGQNYFQTTFDLSFSDKGYATEALANGDVLIAGSTGPAGSEKMWIQRMNAQGVVLWSNVFDDNGMAVARDIQKTADGNFLVVYNTLQVGGWMKISGNGDVLWSKTMGIAGSLQKILPLAAGGYLLSGSGMPTSFSHALAIKTNESGDPVWIAHFGGAGDDVITGCWEDSQGFIYCAGSSADTDLNPDGMLAKIGPNGSVLWATRYRTGNLIEEFSGVAPFSGSTDLLLAGHTVSPLFEYDKIWLIRVTDAGAIKWSRTYELPDLDIAAIDLKPVPGDQFVISAADRANNLGSQATLIKIAQNGDLLWKYEYKIGGERGILREVIPVTGGYLAAGSSVKNGNEDLFVVKVGPEGLLPGAECCPGTVNLTVKDVFPEAESFTPGTSGGFIPLVTFVAGMPVNPDITNICAPIDLAFSVSDSAICPGDYIVITPEGITPGVTYSILTPGGIPDTTQPGKVCYPVNGTFLITRIGENATCKKESSITVDIGSRPDAFPNAFTPNGDGVNDTYKPLFLCPVIATHFIIYNRWGQKVFESLDPDEAWDGKVDGRDAPSDVYGWQVEYEAIREGSKQVLKEKGDVALLR